MSARSAVAAVFLGFALFLTSALAPTAATAQAVAPRAPAKRTELGGRVQFQWNTTSVGGQRGTEFLMRRARIWAATQLNDWIDGAVEVDMAGATAVARTVYVRFTPSPFARISLGQTKRAFDLFELTSSADILVVERDGDVRGAFACAGVGGVCSYSRFSEKLQLSSLDMGVFLQGAAAHGKLGYLFSLTNGPGLNKGEENGAKSVSGRVEWLPKQKVKLSANAALHDYPNAVTKQDDRAPAVGADVELGDFTEGFHLQAGVIAGENWLSLDKGGDASRFLTWQGIATWKIPVKAGGRVGAVEPLARVSWGDPDRDAASDGGLLLTPGVVLYFQGKNKLGANVDVWRPQHGDTVWGLKAQTYLYF